MSALKYFEVDSTYRNRNNYENPYDFVVPYSFPNKGSTTSSFVDPILESSPFTGSLTKQPGQLLTQVSIDTSNISLDSADTSIDNYYINKTLQIGIEFRTILSYNGTTKVATVDFPFSSLPAAGTIYYTRGLASYFNSDVSIVGYDSLTNTVSSLNLLTAVPSPVKDFYAGSYIRFTNGSHVSNTAFITEYDPTGTVANWSQLVDSGYNEYLSTTTEYGFIFTTSGIGTRAISKITINASVFESVSAGRTINVKILDGSLLTSPILYNSNVVLTPTTKTNIDIPISGTFVTSTYNYTLVLRDVTVGGTSTGFVNLFGIDSRDTSLTSINTFLYPYLVVYTYTPTGVQDWIQPTNNNVNDLVSTTTEQGFQFTAANTGSLNQLTINLTSLETLSAGRSLRIRLRSGLGVLGTILYENTFVVSNISLSDLVLTINNPPTISTSTSYTLTVLDTTAGGTLTGFIRLYGITPNVTYVTNSINVYPRLIININSIFGQTVTQQGTKLVATGSLANQRQGIMTALDANGSTFITGGPQPDGAGTGGSVFIFTRTNNTWTQQAALQGSGTGIGQNQGRSVSISGDGNTAVWGAPGDNGGIGAAYVFTRTGGVWTQQGGKLVGSGNIGTSLQGFDIDISFDGNTFAIAGYGDNGGIGAVWVFTRSGGIWTQQAKITATGLIGGSPNFGSSVTISSDGNTIASGANLENGNVGSTFVFTRSGGVWTQQTKLVATGSIGNANQGSSVSLDNTGDTLAVGGPNDNGGIGATWIFTRSGGVWIQQGKVIGSGNIGSSQQGTEASVELSGDGNVLCVGGPSDNGNRGAVWIFTRTGGVWTQQSKITPSDGSGTPLFGRGLNISNSGSHIISGGLNDTSGRGATWIFTGSVNTFSQTTNTAITSVISTVTEQGFRFTSSSGILSEVKINLTSFESASSGRTLEVKVRSGAGVGGTILYSSTVLVTNTGTMTDYSIPVSISLTAGTYTFTLRDITSGGTATGNVYVYGITPNVTYVSYNIPSVYPRLITYISTESITYQQLLNPSITDTISTSTEQGWSFIPSFSGFVVKFTLSITSFSTTSSRTITFKIREGGGVSGTIIYQENINIPNVLDRTDYTVFMDSSLFPTVSSGSTYTLTVIDSTPGGTSTGSTSVYGISNPSLQYNITVYPKLIVYTPSYIIKISPPQDFNGFLNDNTDNIEFNTQAYENATTLLYNGLPSTRAAYYQIGLKYLVLPNQLLDVNLGGHLDNYPYVYVQLFNEGNKGSLKTMNSNNPSSILATFKMPIDKSLYDQPTSFFTLKTISREQVVLFRPDQDIRFRVTLPNGVVVSSATNDNTSPLFPNPFLQVNALFTLLPMDIK